MHTRNKEREREKERNRERKEEREADWKHGNELTYQRADALNSENTTFSFFSFPPLPVHAAIGEVTDRETEREERESRVALALNENLQDLTFHA